MKHDEELDYLIPVLFLAVGVCLQVLVIWVLQ